MLNCISDSITKDFNFENVRTTINERDVELDHLKTTVIALNEKVEVIYIF